MNAKVPQAGWTVVKETVSAVFLVDRDVGRTITNDAERVCKTIHEQYGNKRIIYQDTDTFWNELVHKEGVFKEFQPAQVYATQNGFV